MALVWLVSKVTEVLGRRCLSIACFSGSSGVQDPCCQASLCLPAVPAKLAQLSWLCYRWSPRDYVN